VLAMASPLLLVIGYCMFCAFTMCREMWMDGGRARAARAFRECHRTFDDRSTKMMTETKGMKTINPVAGVRRVSG
jgi:hypothetical protein